MAKNYHFNTEIIGYNELNCYILQSNSRTRLLRTFWGWQKLFVITVNRYNCEYLQHKCSFATKSTKLFVYYIREIVTTVIVITEFDCIMVIIVKIISFEAILMYVLRKKSLPILIKMSPKQYYCKIKDLNLDFLIHFP
jgi:hypothetical protein